MDWQTFEDLAGEVMGRYFNATLVKKHPVGIPKAFDMVSSDGNIVGDAKYLTLVHGKKLPPAKFMEIAGHVWLLEKMNARRRFLAFGNQRRVPEWWLEKYGALVQNVEFYFISDDGKVEKLK